MRVNDNDIKKKIWNGDRGEGYTRIETAYKKRMKNNKREIDKN